VLIAALISTSLLQNVAYAAVGSSPIVPVSTASTPSITWNETADHPRMLQGALSSAVRGESQIYSYLADNKKLYGFTKPQNDLNLIKKDSDSQGKQHYLLQQSYKGIPVYGKYMRAHVDASNQLYAITNQSVPELNDITIDQSSYKVQIKDKDFMLPTKQFELLYMLASQPGKIFTRDQLIESIWGLDYEGDERTVDTHIKKLRKQFKNDEDLLQIITVRGLGYKLEVLS